MVNLISIWVAVSILLSCIFGLDLVLNPFDKHEIIQMWLAGMISITVVVFILVLVII